jgi:hypothetical protein
MAEQLSDEDGCILVLGVTDEDWTPAATDQGIDALCELIAEFNQLASRLRRQARGPHRMLTIHQRREHLET